jgi:hypothetical protein
MTADEADKTRMMIERDLARVNAVADLDGYTLSEKFDVACLKEIASIYHDSGWGNGYICGMRFGLIVCARWLASIGMPGVAMDMMRNYDGNATKPEAA